MSLPYHQNGEGVHMTPRTAPRAVTPVQHTPSATKHVPIETWLLALGLAEYEEIFSRYQGVEDLLSLSESDIRDLGVRNGAHRARMVSTLVIFKDKINTRRMNKGTPRSGTPRNGTPPTSTGGTPPCMGSHPDYATISSDQMSAARVAQVLLGVANNREHPSMRDLSQFGWYHGNIPRQKAEKLMTRDGEFLVRDSLSQPGDFVLTVFWKGIPLHFVLNKHAIEGEGLRFEYQFEDVKFDRPSKLILYYMEARKVVTEMSGAIVSHPVLRTVPLEFYDPRPPEGYSPRGSPWNSPKSSPHGSPHVQRKLGRPHRAGSQPLLSLDDSASYLDPPQPITRKTSMPSLQPKLSTPPVNTVNLGLNSTNNSLNSSLQPIRSSPKTQRKLPAHQRTGSEPSMSPTPTPHPAPRQVANQSQLAGSDGNLSRNPPPKPSRIPTMRKSIDQRPVVQIRNRDLYDDDDGRDYSDYDQIKSWPAALERSAKLQSENHQDILRNSAKPVSTYDVPKSQNRNAQFMYDVPKSISVLSSRSPEDPRVISVAQFTLPNLDGSSELDLSVYDSELLTPNNKPLEPSAVTTIKALLLESSHTVMARHLTSVDLHTLKVIGRHDLGLGVYSGLELLTLPHGNVLRQDIIERYQCLSLFVALTIVMCSQCSDRSRMIHQWIQIAVELRGNLGNLFGFSAVMAGLKSPQIRRLSYTWTALRESYSESVFIFEHRLCGFMRALDNASATLPLQNITIPHVMPLVLLMERDLSDIGALLSLEEDNDSCVDVMVAHLDTARIVTQQCGLYRVTAENLLSDFHSRRDLVDIFKTQMHMKLLWGSRGAGVSQSERLNKFPVVLDLLSQRVEGRNPGDTETSV